jgi:hypothetical protein
MNKAVIQQFYEAFARRDVFTILHSICTPGQISAICGGCCAATGKTSALYSAMSSPRMIREPPTGRHGILFPVPVARCTISYRRGLYFAMAKSLNILIPSIFGAGRGRRLVFPDFSWAGHLFCAVKCGNRPWRACGNFRQTGKTYT